MQYRTGDIADLPDGRSLVYTENKGWLPAQVEDGPNGAVLVNIGQGWQDPYSPAFRAQNMNLANQTTAGPYMRFQQFAPASPFVPKEGLTKTIENVPSSALKFAKDTASAVVNPLDTLEGLGKVGLGYGQKGLGLLGLDWLKEYEPHADAVNQHFGERLSDPAKTLTEDPVGFFGDLSMFASGLGGGLRAAGATAAKVGGAGSQAANIARNVGDVGRKVSAAAQAIDPLSAASKAADILKISDLVNGAIKAASEKLYGSALKANVNNPAELSAIIRTGIDEGLIPTYGGVNKAYRQIEKLAEKAADAINQRAIQEENGLAPINIDPNVIAQNALGRVEDVYQTGSPTRDLRQADRAIDDFLKWFGRNNLTTSQAQKLKSKTQNKVSSSYDNLSTPTKEAEKALAFQLKEKVNANVPEVVPLNQSMSNIYDLLEHLPAAAKRNANANPLSLTWTSLIGGGIGGGLGASFGGDRLFTTLGTLGAAALGSYLSSAPNKARYSIALDRLNNISPYARTGLNVGRAFQATGGPSLLDMLGEEK